MSHTSSGSNRRRRISVEGLETRALLTTAVMLYGRQAQLAHHVAAVTEKASVTAAAIGSPLDALGVPTSHEVARRYFMANYVGNFFTGPGQTSLQSLRTQIRGAGTSNQFRHSNLSVVITNPTDPTSPVTGGAALFDKNSGNTGNVLVLDLSSSPGQDPSKPPQSYTWNVNGSSGGIYTGATGAGTLEIRYGAGNLTRPVRSSSSGRAFVMFKGSISTTGLGNNTQF